MGDVTKNTLVALATTLVAAVAAVLIAFGVNLSKEQVDAVIALVGVLGSVVVAALAYVHRSRLQSRAQRG